MIKEDFDFETELQTSSRTKLETKPGNVLIITKSPKPTPFPMVDIIVTNMIKFFVTKSTTFSTTGKNNHESEEEVFVFDLVIEYSMGQ